jgi:enolase
MFSKIFARRSFSIFNSATTSTIKSVKAREILDSRGNPTVEVDLNTSTGHTFRASVPSGASTGTFEALELRDKDPKRYNGKGVLKAVDNVNKIIAPALLGLDVTKQSEIDNKMSNELDGTQNEWGSCKQKLGANAILAVSLALARAGAQAKNVPLYSYIAQLSGLKTNKFVIPCPSLNIINGGQHAGNKIEMQEFMILPTGAKSFREGMQLGCEVYHTLAKILKKKYGLGSTLVGDEGGFGAPQIKDENEALELIVEAIKQAGHEGKIEIALDAAASEFYEAGKDNYNLGKKAGNSDRILSKDDLVNLYADLSSRYPIASIEDPFDQEDFASYRKLTEKIGKKVQIVGDDLLVTNPKRIHMAIKEKACNALLLKVNQIGTLTESIEAAQLSQKQGWGVMVSHRSGETEDSFIGDLVVGLGTGEIKSGAPCRSDRLAKYNQIIRIEEELGGSSVYAGKSFRDPRHLLNLL